MILYSQRVVLKYSMSQKNYLFMEYPYLFMKYLRLSMSELIFAVN